MRWAVGVAVTGYRTNGRGPDRGCLAGRASADAYTGCAALSAGSLAVF